MKKIFGFLAPRSSTTKSCGNNGGRTPETEEGITLEAKYLIRDKDLRTLHRAACTGNAQLVQQLLLGRPYHANVRDKRNRTALHLACAAGHLSVVTVLVNEGCHLNLRDLANRTALMMAIQCQKQECAALLLKHGADPHLQDADGNTALHYTVLNKNTVVAEKLLLLSADIEAKNKCGLTPLLLAIKKCNHQMVEFLIKKNANIHAVDNKKRTALMLAAKDNSSKMVRLLLQHGVDASCRDWREQTAEDYAHLMGCKVNIELISNYKEERRCKESSETSNLGSPSPEIYPHLEPIVEVEDPGPAVTAKEEDVETAIPELEDRTAPGEERERLNVVAEQNVTQKTFSPEQNCGWLLAIDLCKQKGMEIELEKMNSEEKTAEPTTGKQEYGMDVIESAPQRQTNNDSLVYVNGARNNNGHVNMYALALEEEEDVDSSWDSEHLGEVEDHDPERAVEEKGVHTSKAEHMKRTLPVSHPVSKPVHVTEAVEEPDGSRAVEGKGVRIRVRELHLGTPPEEESLDGSKSNHTCFVPEQSVAQKPRSAQQNAGWLGRAIPTEDLCKPKQRETDLKEMNSESSPSRHPATYVGHFSGAAAPKGKYALPGQVGEHMKRTLPVSHPVSKPVHVTEAVEEPDGSRAVEGKGVRVRVRELHLGTPPEEESPDGSKSNHPCFVPEQSVAQKPRSPQQNAGCLESAIPTNDLGKLKKRELDLKENNSKIFLLSHLGERNLRQRQRLKDDIGHMYQSDTYRRKLKSIEERVSQLEGQNKLLQQQLNDARNKSDLEVQEQLQDVRKILLTIVENQSHILEDKNKELIKEFGHFKEKTKVVVRQLQEEVDTLRKQSMSQELEVPSPYHVTLQAEIQDLKKTLRQHRNLIADLAYKKKEASPERAHWEERNESHQQELLSMRETLNKCEKLKNEKEIWKQELLNLKSYIATNMATKNEIEKNKRELEERIGQYLSETYINFYKLLQQRDASQDKLEQLTENNITSMKSQMEQRIKDLESQLSKVTTSQESIQIKLEKYMHLYQEELKNRTSFEYKLNKMEESLAETRAQLARERQSSGCCTAPARLVLEPPHAGGPSSTSLLRRDPAPRDVWIPTSTPRRRASEESVDAFAARVSYIAASSSNHV